MSEFDERVAALTEAARRQAQREQAAERDAAVYLDAFAAAKADQQRQREQGEQGTFVEHAARVAAAIDAFGSRAHAIRDMRRQKGRPITVPRRDLLESIYNAIHPIHELLADAYEENRNNGR